MQTEPPPQKLLDRVRDNIRVKQYSKLTKGDYVQYTIEELNTIVGVKKRIIRLGTGSH